MPARPVQLDIYRTTIPMRKLQHAAATRNVAEAIVVRVELSDGVVGWGETLPRGYVTGETLETVPVDLERIFWPAMADGDPEGADLPVRDGDRAITAARCAVELALRDAWNRTHWSVRSWRSEVDALRKIRVSGVIGSDNPAKTAWQLRAQRLYGLKDIKLKLGLGDDVDAENLRIVTGRLKRGIASGKVTLRVDVNGGWNADETPERIDELARVGVRLVEQPVFCSAGELVELAQKCALPIMADESVITIDDAYKCIWTAGKHVWLSLRLSKNGGIGPCGEMAFAAAESGVPFSVGCMVGESSIISAAQRALLGSVPRPEYVEGNYGAFLLIGDLTAKSVRMRWGGRLKYIGVKGYGVDPTRRRLARYGQLIKTLER